MTQHAHEIVKVGAAVVRDGLLLIVREFGDSAYILPGGRPEEGEGEIDTLKRELEEELSGSIRQDSQIQYLGEFSDKAATDPKKIVKVRLYLVVMDGSLSGKGEIEETRWFNRKVDDAALLAPSIRNRILPFLIDSHIL